VVNYSPVLIRAAGALGFPDLVLDCEDDPRPLQVPLHLGGFVDLGEDRATAATEKKRERKRVKERAT